MAHASVASLMRTIESLLIINSPMRSLSCDHREELSALREKVSSLEVFVKDFEKNNVSGEMTDFEVEVKEVASASEHTFQLRVTEVLLANDEKTHERLSDTLQLVAEDIDRIWKVSTKIQDKGKQVSEGSLVQDISSSTNNILKVNNNMVGRDDQKERLLEDLTGSYSGEPKVIPIVGMGGIGKTTLAKEVYNHESILSHFDIRAWATVSQQHNIKEVLLSLLQSTIKMDDMVKMSGEAELADMLQKSVKRKRYLIVLDDIWSFEVWDGVTRCFPTEDNASSRILLPTRNNEVACYAVIENLSLHMSFMDQDESWGLFKSAAFSSEALTYEFETVGKQIADECHGLPLTIVVVVGLLKSKREIEDWEGVAKDVKSFVTNNPDERCSRVLGLSYDHLTSDLKTYW
ncbi:putative late blight resistance protein R1B-16 [Capsicum chacoense]